MFIDSRQLDPAARIDATVCIIGGGVAGLTIALEMERLGIATCLLESGGFHPDDATRDLYRGSDIGLPYRFADGCRSRYLGGSSNCWGGWCRPLDAWDFAARPWIPHSGWPFGIEELAPYYLRTHAVLRLGPQNYAPDYWAAAIDRADVRRLPLTSGKVRDTISQFSPPVRFGTLYRGDLMRSQHVRVYLWANATGLTAARDGNSLQQVEAATLDGRKFSVKARFYVLASGGIENARLLLASNGVQRAGLGNGNDLVGRYFMDHPRMLSGRVDFQPAWRRNKLYDIKYHYQNAAVAAGGTQIAAQLALSEPTLASEGLLNARVWFCSTFPGEGSAAAAALFRYKQAVLKKDQPGWRPLQDAAMMARHPLDTLGYGVTRLLQPRCLIRDVRFQAIVEPEPDPRSRVTLSTTERDALGMPRVRVDWRLGGNVQRTFDRTLAIIGAELERSGVASVTLDPPIEGGAWPASLEPEGTWHHMGTTRMHDSPRHGVVDRHCRVHGVGNLYVAGSSLFPTAGANFPTITLTALALRLADHLGAVARHADAAPARRHSAGVMV
ncbi:GMC oxidoreductase [Duganella aceris]|jgi:choline dehydrogenase-like flavoprotein|uniref:GMC family oxidoreductase n=1 Tax=Duganella aceris TaxID=2703883 RepID=A0ABX0FJR6_9BURK|nr:GMC family oxidoreductase [Duganella aceris]NGZ84767.1 GMC family oxidoreductase [Duganella aceris]